MPAFSFEALDSQGQTRKGLIEADTAKSARSILRAQSLLPMAVAPVAAGSASTDRGADILTRSVMGATQLAVWTRQLAGLVSAGLPLERALTSLSEESDNER